MAEYIEREKILTHLEETKQGLKTPAWEWLLDALIKCYKTFPAADVVEVRNGEWIEGAEHFTNGFYEAECSECNNYIRWNEGNSGEWNYCPNCGAKMG